MPSYRNPQDLANLSHEDLVNMLVAANEQLAKAIKQKHSKDDGSARRLQVLAILLEGKFTTAEIATRISLETNSDFSKANVASYLAYLRKDGCMVEAKKSDPRHYIDFVKANARPYILNAVKAAGKESLIQR